MRLLASCCLLVAACGRIDFGDTGTGPGSAVASAAGTLAAGAGFSCAVRDGAVWCWGRSDVRQLGVDTLAPQPLPVRVSLSVRATRVAANDLGACALSEAGAVWCWGDNALPGQLPGLPRPARAISLGGGHGCAILDDSSLWCWGSNGAGEVGVDPATLPTVAVPVQILESVHDVAAGDDFTCAARNDASVWCWGNNFVGALGDGTMTSRFTPAPVPGVSAIAVAAGRLHACALDVDGSFRCWGNNGEGQLGAGSTDEMSLSPTAPSSPADFVAITAGALTTCAIDSTGQSWCWGNGNNGEQGDGHRYDYASPMNHGDTEVVAIAEGDAHGCLEHADGVIQCWGYGSHGELGDGRLAALVPRKVPLPGPVTFITAGKEHACALAPSGNQMWCWGSNDAGELGVIDDTNPQGSSITPIQVTLPTPINWIGAGDGHSCAVANGTMICWGRNDVGQAGSLPIEYAHAPTPVSGVSGPFGAGCAGEQFSCTLTSSGMSCWGADGYGQLGDGGGPASVAPRLVGAGQRPTCGGSFGCSQIAGGGIGCWGDNSLGQIGIGAQDSALHKLTAIASGATTYSYAVAGASHACAVYADTSGIDCWGLNDSGQLGDGTTMLRPAPTKVLGLTGISTIAAGGETTCALGSAADCWGLNDVGQVGDGTTITRTTPVAVPVDAFDIAVGDRFACAALFSDSSVVCWGDNDAGQIGSGPQTRVLSPVNVMLP